MTPERTLEEVQNEYKAVFGKLPNAFKSNQERLQGKLDARNVDPVAEETPEVETPEVETPEVETPEVETPEVESKGNHDELLKIQSFYGITNDELHNEDILVNKFKLSQKELAIVRKYTAKGDEEIEFNLTYHEMPDYIQAISQKYGFNGETLKTKKSIEALIYGDNKHPDKQKQQEVTQLVEYAMQLKSELSKNDTINENPMIKQ